MLTDVTSCPYAIHRHEPNTPNMQGLPTKSLGGFSLCLLHEAADAATCYMHNVGQSEYQGVTRRKAAHIECLSTQCEHIGSAHDCSLLKYPNTQ